MENPPLSLKAQSKLNPKKIEKADNLPFEGEVQLGVKESLKVRNMYLRETITGNL